MSLTDLISDDVVLHVFGIKFGDIRYVDLPSFQFVLASQSRKGFLFDGRFICCSHLYGKDLSSLPFVGIIAFDKERFHNDYQVRELYLTNKALVAYMGVHKNIIVSCSPGKDFPAVSVTGGRCDLMCGHCSGVHLKGMIHAETPAKLYDIAKGVKSAGGSGLLVSGGSNIDGKVPLSEFAPSIRKISEMGLDVNVHPGIIDKKDAELLVSSGVSCFTMEVHQDPEVIRNIFHLEGPEVYENSIDAVLEVGGKVMPHLTVGFSHGDLAESASLVKRKGLDEVVMLVLVPTKGTELENKRVSEDEISDSVNMLLKMGLDVTLGCMRDRRMRNIERMCIEAGITKMANMSLETEVWAISQGYKVEKTKRCCCFPLKQ